MLERRCRLYLHPKSKDEEAKLKEEKAKDIAYILEELSKIAVLRSNEVGEEFSLRESLSYLLLVRHEWNSLKTNLTQSLSVSGLVAQPSLTQEEAVEELELSPSMSYGDLASDIAEQEQNMSTGLKVSDREIKDHSGTDNIDSRNASVELDADVLSMGSMSNMFKRSSS
ncbi:hypothetical protein EAY39_15295 [Vibrio anguillarum]|uniref:hypothetical protein n=1 Tax=Vibrio anguillarum TaxID=55601 RepID=UPI00188BF895|nr:hypothetical protein [Vibrio anguillarum]MBF4342129.1 hypothetical protein [Vibrio anguillarum]MBF4370680.1 hypothetical protein [Vibrio anguillarum]